MTSMASAPQKERENGEVILYINKLRKKKTSKVRASSIFILYIKNSRKILLTRTALI